LIRLNIAGAGIFAMPNAGDGITHYPRKTCRCANNVIRVRAQFIDCDKTPPDVDLLRTAPPHMLVNTSPGKWHVYWLVSDCPINEFKQRQKALIQRFDSDPQVCDLPHVMRIPGFIHQKGQPFLSTLHTTP
jgi:hypothetical protein